MLVGLVCGCASQAASSDEQNLKLGRNPLAEGFYDAEGAELRVYDDTDFALYADTQDNCAGTLDLLYGDRTQITTSTTDGRCSLKISRNGDRVDVSGTLTPAGGWPRDISYSFGRRSADVLAGHYVAIGPNVDSVVPTASVDVTASDDSGLEFVLTSSDSTMLFDGWATYPNDVLGYNPGDVFARFSLHKDGGCPMVLTATSQAGGYQIEIYHNRLEGGDTDPTCTTDDLNIRGVYFSESGS